MLFRSFRLIGAVLLLLSGGLVGPSYAQTSLGQIAGTVSDATGAVIPGATVTITNLGTQAIRATVSDSTGFYVMTNLPIGDYSVEVKTTGYRSERRSGLSIVADAHLTADFQLQIGVATEAVSVTAVTAETLKHN